MRTRGFIFAFLIITGCTSAGGGDSESSSPDTAVPPPVDTVLGTRAVPGFALTVSYPEALIPGTTRTVEVHVVPDAESAVATMVEARLSSTPEATWLAGTPVPGSAHTWGWVFTVPADLTHQRVWVRITDAAGNVGETGTSDFALITP